MRYTKALEDKLFSGTEKKTARWKTTRQQYSVYIEKLQNKVAFRNNKYNPKTRYILKHTSEGLTLKLNSTEALKET
jgi:hypothetical protein